MRKAGRHPSDRDLHRIRIGAKQLRYAAEAATPVVGERARRTAKKAERLQEILGEHHDAVNAEEWLRIAGLEGPVSARFEAGVLAAGERTRQRELRQEWQRQRRSLASKNEKRWLAAP